MGQGETNSVLRSLTQLRSLSLTFARECSSMRDDVLLHMLHVACAANSVR